MLLAFALAQHSRRNHQQGPAPQRNSLMVVIYLAESRIIRQRASRFFAIRPINTFAKEYLEQDSGNYVENALESKNH